MDTQKPKSTIKKGLRVGAIVAAVGISSLIGYEVFTGSTPNNHAEKQSVTIKLPAADTDAKSKAEQAVKMLISEWQ